MAVVSIKLLIGLTWMLVGSAFADDMLVDQFDSAPESRWSYVSDQVMGGVSQGNAVYLQEGSESIARLAGSVSTDNNGGFIQIRREVAKGSVDDAAGIYLKVRGNSQAYYIHLRTAGTMLPWQYYQAEFEVAADWQVIRIPLSDFQPSSFWLSAAVNASSIRSVGIVAYGRDHEAEVNVAEVGFYQ
ncbi:MAG: CIA30 family protein [Halioglobus sp.]|nr:CIA30 family protein [Halioglobus sp.]